MGAVSVNLSDEMLVGLTLEEAKAKGCDVRATSIDGVPCVVNCDFDPKRINVAIKDGKIVSVGNRG